MRFELTTCSLRVSRSANSSYRSMVGPPGFEPGLLRLKGGYAASNILAPQSGSGPPNRTEIISGNSRAHDRCARPELFNLVPGRGLEPRCCANRAHILPLDEPGMEGAVRLELTYRQLRRLVADPIGRTRPQSWYPREDLNPCLHVRSVVS